MECGVVSHSLPSTAAPSAPWETVVLHSHSSRRWMLPVRAKVQGRWLGSRSTRGVSAGHPDSRTALCKPWPAARVLPTPILDEMRTKVETER